MVFIMKAFMMSKEAVLKDLNSSPDTGLSKEGVIHNAEKFGENVLNKTKPISLIRRIVVALCEPLMIMLIVAALIAFGVNIVLWFTNGEADFLECVGILIAIVFCVGLTVGMEGKSAKAFEALAKINDDVIVKVIRDGEPMMTSQKEIVVGDIVVIETGVRIPADGRLLESSELQSDESSLTGESVPVLKNADVIFDGANSEKVPVAERTNMLYSGSFITGGNGKMVVTEVGQSTEFGKIASELSENVKTSTPLQEKLTKMGKAIAFFGISAAAVSFIIQLVMFLLADTATFQNIAETFITSVVLIVAAVPEGLPAIVAVSLAISVIKMSKQNALVKKMVACETVGCINVICSDKTGTLTENRMTMVNAIENEWILKNICINSTADISDGTLIGNPTECALLAKANNSLNQISDDVKTYKDVRQNTNIVKVCPFSSEEKSMTTITCNSGSKHSCEVAYIKGSPEKIMELCKNNRDADKIRSFQEKACRIIAFAHSIDGSKSWEYDGFAAITDPLRSDVLEAVKNCRSAGISLKILTGDNIITATAIGNELGILEDENSLAVEAHELENLSDTELTEALDNIRIIARSTPTIKMRIVKLLKAQGHVVAVTGDGINDAPAIKNADVGIAMGIAGTEVSKEASDIVLLDDSFATIAKAVKWGRNIYENFQRFIVFQLTVNLSTVAVVLASILFGMGAPFTALQLLWINIIMDGPPAIALGLEPIAKNSDLMKRKPTKRNAPIISKAMGLRIVVISAFIIAVALYQNLFDFLGAANLAYGDSQHTALDYQRTVFFALFATFKLFNALNSREMGNTSIFKNFFANRLVLSAVGLAFVAQIAIVQYGGAFFRTVPLPLDMWLRIFGVAASVIIVSELLRMFRKNNCCA